METRILRVNIIDTSKKPEEDGRIVDSYEVETAADNETIRALSSMIKESLPQNKRKMALAKHIAERIDEAAANPTPGIRILALYLKDVGRDQVLAAFLAEAGEDYTDEQLIAYCKNLGDEFLKDSEVWDMWIRRGVQLLKKHPEMSRRAAADKAIGLLSWVSEVDREDIVSRLKQTLDKVAPPKRKNAGKRCAGKKNSTRSR